MSELLPCKCGADINETFEVQLLWKGYGDVETSGWPKDPPVGWGC